MKAKRIIKRGIIIIFISFLLLLSSYIYASKNEGLMMLLSITRFSGETLNDPGYILYDVDLMELCREYLNSDTVISGEMLLSHIKDIGFSMSMDIDGKRSFSQKKFSAKTDMDVLFLNVGEMDLYAEENMAYMVAPMLKNLSYAFDTGFDLFFKAPELKSDINAAWFKENRDNIREFTKEIEIEETGDYIDDNGIKSKGYHVTIKKGSGLFIFDLLSVDPPKRDISYDIYITPSFKMRRIVFDLSETIKDSAMESSVLTLDGEDCGTIIWDIGLPDDESVRISAVRNGEYTSSDIIDFDIIYNAKTNDIYKADFNMYFKPYEDKTDIRISDLTVYMNDRKLLDGYYDGTIEKNKEGFNYDLFKDEKTDLKSIEIIKWERLRDDMDGFIDEVMEKIKGTL